ncbi:MAG: glycosyltransferase [Candidatus Dormibacteria bacterium]
MRVALVHDYLVDRGGAERFLLHMHDLYPDAPVYTSLYRPESTFAEFASIDVRTSYLQHTGLGRGSYKLLLPFFPAAFESFDLSGYDVVLSQTTSFAKGVLTRPETVHVCYCNTPTRFIWRYHDYVEQEDLGPAMRFILPAVVHRLRDWDYLAAQRVDVFLANSRNTQARIRKFYRRDSQVLHGPVDTARFTPAAAAEVEDYFVCVSRLAPYKRLDLAIDAFNQLRRRLVVVGAGPDLERLRRRAGPTIEFAGELDRDELNRAYARAQAFILPGEEDFGITPLEANAAGTPVIAYAAGGALETVVPGRTGELFSEQDPASLCAAIRSFRRDTYSTQALLAHARTFDAGNFKQSLGRAVEDALAGHGAALGDTPAPVIS